MAHWEARNALPVLAVGTAEEGRDKAAGWIIDGSLGWKVISNVGEDMDVTNI